MRCSSCFNAIVVTATLAHPRTHTERVGKKSKITSKNRFGIAYFMYIVHHTVWIASKSRHGSTVLLFYLFVFFSVLYLFPSFSRIFWSLQFYTDRFFFVCWFFDCFRMFNQLSKYIYIYIRTFFFSVKYPIEISSAHSIEKKERKIWKNWKNSFNISTMEKFNFMPVR